MKENKMTQMTQNTEMKGANSLVYQSTFLYHPFTYICICIFFFVAYLLETQRVLLLRALGHNLILMLFIAKLILAITYYSNTVPALYCLSALEQLFPSPVEPCSYP